MSTNPYESLYKSTVQKISPTITMKQAEEMAIQMSLIYNAFGIALKDLVGLLSIMYSGQFAPANINKPTSKIIQQPQYDSDLSSKSSKHQSKIKNEKKNIQEKDNSLQIVDFDKYKLELKENEKKIFGNNKRNIDKNQAKNTQSTSNSRQSKPVERIETVRGKKQRQTLNGYSCTMCEKFYKLFDTDFTDLDGTNKMCNNCSRHRSNLPPTNFFNDFSQQFELDD